MSEDNLETLSNKEIRSKCLELGLPNVPVTDSSRKVLIKKLRLSLGGDHAALASPKKTIAQRDEKNSRRSVSTNNESLIINGNRTSAASDLNFRRTAVVTLQQIPQTLASAETVQPPLAEKSQTVKIGNRRKSQQKTTEVAKRSNANNDIPTVIIESDEEDDELIIAAEQVEQDQLKLPKSTNNRAPTFSKTGVTMVNSFAAEAVPMRKNFSNENVESYNIFLSTKAPKVLPTSAITTDAALNYRKKTFINENPYPMDGLQGPSEYSNKFQRFATGTGNFGSDKTSVYVTNVPPKFTSTINSNYNEFSDNEVGIDSGDTAQMPFLSRFAQNLERSRSGPSGRSTAVTPGQMRGDYKYHYDRQNRQQSTKYTFGQTFANWERKYNLKRNILVLVVVLAIISLFILFWQ